MIHSIPTLLSKEIHTLCVWLHRSSLWRVCVTEINVILPSIYDCFQNFKQFSINFVSNCADMSIPVILMFKCSNSIFGYLLFMGP